METHGKPPAEALRAGSHRLGGMHLATVMVSLMLSFLLEALDQTVVGAVVNYSLALAIQHGLQTALLFCSAAIVASVVLRDAPQ